MIRQAAQQSILPPSGLWLASLAFCALLFGCLEPALSKPPIRIVWYTLLSILATIAVAWSCRARKQFDVFEPLLLMFGFFVVSYPVRILFAVALDESWFDPYKAAAWRGLFASVLGFTSFAVGYRFYCRRRSILRRKIWLDGSWNLSRARVISIVFLIIGLAGFVTMYSLSGSLLYFITLDPQTKAPDSISVWYFYILWICLFVQVGALIQLGNWLTDGSQTLWTIAYFFLALVSSFVLSRNFTVLFLIMCALCWHYRRRNIKIIEIAAIFLLVVGYLAVAGLYREWVSPGGSLDHVTDLADLATQQDQLVLRYVVSNLEQFSNLSDVTVMTPRELPYQFGSTFVPLLLKPIPRALMPSKPLGASAVFSRHIAPDSYENGLATALGAWGEWYLNFGWFGIIVGMASMGAVTAASYRAILSTQGFARVLLYLSFLVILLSWLRSDFQSSTTYGLYYLLPSIFALMYINRQGSCSGQIAEPFQP
jgi:hypothetical protein